MAPIHNRLKLLLVIASCVLGVLTVGCRTPQLPLTGLPTIVPTAEQPRPEEFLPTEGIAGTRSLIYDIGSKSIKQSFASEEFAEMPVPLIGTISVPEGEGPFPVAIVLHGRHPRCYADEAQLEEVWPCPPDTEPRYDSGFSYLLDSLSAQGYLAVAPSVNGAYTTAFGLGQPTLDEAQPWIDERMIAIVQAHLEALAAAGDGLPVFGEFLDLTGKVDLSQVALIAHSTSGITANKIARDGLLPVRSLLLLAAMHFEGTGATADVPTVIILAACDGDRPNLPAQTYFENARTVTDRNAPIASILLAGANHNFFNSTLAEQGIDDAAFVRNPDCAAERLSADEQQSFLAETAVALVDFGFRSGDPPAFLAITTSPPRELNGRSVQVSQLPPASRRQQLIIPPPDAATTPPGIAGGSLEVTTCPPAEKCAVDMLQPGLPGQYRLSWSTPDAVYRVEIPPEKTTGDLLRLRVAVDPTHRLNAAAEPVHFRVALIDAAGNRAVQDLPAPVPFPSRAAYPGDEFRFTPVLPVDMRIPLAAFTGIDLSALASIELIFDQSPAGSVLVTDLDLLDSRNE